MICSKYQSVVCYIIKIVHNMITFDERSYVPCNIPPPKTDLIDKYNLKL